MIHFKHRFSALLLSMTTLVGCVGSMGMNPHDLVVFSDAKLLDRTFQIEDVAGRGVIDYSHITLTFGQEGLFSGSGGCNAIFGTYERDQTVLKLGSIATTKKLCPPALMHQEQAVLAILSDVTRIEKDHVGALIVSTSDGRRLRGFESTPLRVHHYQCDDGTEVTVRYPSQDTAQLIYKDQTVAMTLARSASGARYIGEGWQWWTKGAVQADLTPLIDGETMTSDKGMACRKQSELQ